MKKQRPSQPASYFCLHCVQSATPPRCANLGFTETPSRHMKRNFLGHHWFTELQCKFNRLEILSYSRPQLVLLSRYILSLKSQFFTKVHLREITSKTIKIILFHFYSIFSCTGLLQLSTGNYIKYNEFYIQIKTPAYIGLHYTYFPKPYLRILGICQN